MVVLICLQNYETTQNFLRCLELYAPSAEAVYAMRDHDLYHNFDRRWQLPVYFQLRWKEIIVDVEEAFSEVRIEPFPIEGELVLPKSHI